MPTFINFPEVNRHLGPPKGMTEAECGTLPVYTDGRSCVSCWQLSDEEIRQLINNDGKIWLGVMSGTNQPPVFLDVNCPIGYSPSHELTADIEDALRQFAERLPVPEQEGQEPKLGADLLKEDPTLRTPEGLPLDPKKLYYLAKASTPEEHHQNLCDIYRREGQPGVVRYLQPYEAFLGQE